VAEKDPAVSSSESELSELSELEDTDIEEEEPAEPEERPSILTVSQQFCTESRYPLCLFFGDGQTQNDCYRYRELVVCEPDRTQDAVATKVHECNKEMRREVLIKCHSSGDRRVPKRSRITDLYTPPGIGKRYTWKDCRKICFSACDILSEGRPPVLDLPISLIVGFSSCAYPVERVNRNHCSPSLATIVRIWNTSTSFDFGRLTAKTWRIT
jgi:hypothetical protein